MGAMKSDRRRAKWGEVELGYGERGRGGGNVGGGMLWGGRVAVEELGGDFRVCVRLPCGFCAGAPLPVRLV